jgi:hypothetical protein
MKARVEDYLALDIGALTRAGVFRAPVGTLCESFWTDAAGREILRIEFHLSGGSTPCFIHIGHIQEGAPTPAITLGLTHVQCRFGGVKYSVRCPGKGDGNACDRPVRKIYWIDGTWLCRHCGDLTYIARQQHDRRRDALRRDPVALLAALRSDNRSRQFLAMRAAVEELSRLSKRKM